MERSRNAARREKTRRHGKLFAGQDTNTKGVAAAAAQLEVNRNRTSMTNRPLSLAALATLSLLLAACGNRQDDAADPAQPVADETPAEVTAPAAELPADETAADQPLEVVEESDAEVEPEDQPIILARAEDPAAGREWQFVEGRHYVRLTPTQPTFGGADKIEVAEFFWYGCPACYDLEPYVTRWLEDKPADVRFIYVPASWNRLVALHARLFYAAEVLARNGDLEDPKAFRQAVFTEYHQRRNQLASEDAIRGLFERFGVGAEAFDKTWESFEVEQNLRKASDLARRYGVSSVPQVVVNGKYRSGAQEAGGYDTLMEVVDELVERERLR